MTEDNAHTGALRASLAECVSDLRMPDGLLDRAVARNRKRTARNRLISAAGTAVAAGTAAAVIISVPGQPADRQAAAQSTVVTRAQTAAYVLQRAAAAEANSYRMISVSQDSGGTTYTGVATQQQRYDAGLRASTGGPYYQITEVIKGGVWTYTTIDHQHHVYDMQTASAKDHHGSAAVTISSYLPLQDKADPGAAFQAALKQGIITVAGHRNLGGRDTILLSVRPLTKLKFPVGVPRPPRDQIWVDASTYLVVQTENFEGRFGMTKAGKPDWGTFKWSPAITMVSWLRATPGNLATLTVAPPHGYTQVSSSDMDKYLGPIGKFNWSLQALPS